jgi:hypothetical protein
MQIGRRKHHLGKEWEKEKKKDYVELEKSGRMPFETRLRMDAETYKNRAKSRIALAKSKYNQTKSKARHIKEKFVAAKQSKSFQRLKEAVKFAEENGLSAKYFGKMQRGVKKVQRVSRKISNAPRKTQREFGIGGGGLSMDLNIGGDMFGSSKKSKGTGLNLNIPSLDIGGSSKKKKGLRLEI